MTFSSIITQSVCQRAQGNDASRECLFSRRVHSFIGTTRLDTPTTLVFRVHSVWRAERHPTTYQGTYPSTLSHRMQNEFDTLPRDTRHAIQGCFRRNYDVDERLSDSTRSDHNNKSLSRTRYLGSLWAIEYEKSGE